MSAEKEELDSAGDTWPRGSSTGVPDASEGEDCECTCVCDGHWKKIQNVSKR